MARRTRKTPKKKPSGSAKERANRTILGRTFVLMILCGVVLFIPLIATLYNLMITDHEKYEEMALESQTRSTTLTAARGMIYDRNMNIMAASATYPHLYGETCWTVYSDGRIVLSLHGKIGEAIAFEETASGAWRFVENPVRYIPKFGLRFEMNKEFDNVRYFGMGPVESYRDKNLASYMGVFETTPEKEFVDYIKPQECANHYNTVWSSVDNGCYGIAIENINNTFDFSAIPYTSQELSSYKHNFELPLSDKTVVSVDYKNSGVGSGSCGPQLKKSARFNETEFDWCISFLPFKK